MGYPTDEEFERARERRALPDDKPKRDPTFAEIFMATAVEIHQIAVKKGFWADRSDEVALLLIHAEVSEAVEVLRMPEGEAIPSQKIPEHSALAEELADVVIRVMDFAAAKGIDLGAAIDAKIAFNRTRPHKHGKRF